MYHYHYCMWKREVLLRLFEGALMYRNSNQCTVYCVQCTVYCVQCTVYCAQSWYTEPYTIHIVKYPLVHNKNYYIDIVNFW